MGETMAETFRDQIEIDIPISSESAFKQSVSFGRFENDLLSWERWSSFSQNKYLEEVGKCSTPGSVAKKKAYFEAHYKKIAARKAEMDQEQEMEDDDLFRSDTQSNENPISNGCATKLDFDAIGVEGDTGSVESENNSMPVWYSTQTKEPNQGVAGESIEDISIEFEGEELANTEDSPKSKASVGAILVDDEDKHTELQCNSDEMFELIIEDNNSYSYSMQPGKVDNLIQERMDLIEVQDPLEQPDQLENATSHALVNKGPDAKSNQQEETSHTLVKKRQDAKSNQPEGPQKRTSASKDKNLVKTKMKPITSTTKAAHSSLPRASMPMPASPLRSASKVSSRKESSPSLQKKRSPTSVKKNTQVSNSLHMSLSLEPTSSVAATPTPARRSFIMESMGDKDIVKRAFRSFQNNLSLSKPSAEEQSSIPRQHSTKVTRVPYTSVAPQKDKDRVKKPVEDTSSQRRQVSARANSVPASRPVRGVGRQQTSAKASLSPGLKSDEREIKRNELPRNLDEKSNTKEAERPRLRPQYKEKKEAETKKLSQSLNLKASSVRDYNQGQRLSQSRGSKVGAGNENQHQTHSLR